jgi:hypothetical protein
MVLMLHQVFLMQLITQPLDQRLCIQTPPGLEYSKRNLGLYKNTTGSENVGIGETLCNQTQKVAKTQQ